MNKIEKYLTESKEKEYLKSIDLGEVNYFEDHYNRAYDHLEKVVDTLEAFNDDSGGLFKKDLAFLQTAWVNMRKVKVGKYF